MLSKLFTAVVAMLALTSLGFSSSVVAKERPLISAERSVQLPINTPYADTIVGYGTNEYEFTTVGAGEYRISITGAGTDMSWDLFRDPIYSDLIDYCDEFADAQDESCIVNLSAGTTYYMWIDEWSYVDAAFTVLIQSR